MKKILSKKEFVKYINKIKEIEDRWSEFYEVLDVYPGDYNLSLIDEVVSLLELAMHDDVDKKYGSWISWFCWETNFGQDDKLNKIYVDRHFFEEEIVINTPEKLYDLLVDNIKEREEDN